MAETKKEEAAAYAIAPESLVGKGVSAQTNPMEKPEDEAKAVFDELSKDIIIPAFNRFVLFMAAQLGMIDMTKDADKPISTAMQTALDGKQDREKRTGSETLYKVLTDNNFTDEAAEQLAAAFAALHEHANKSLLDGLTQTDIDNWNGANVLTKDNTTPYEPRGEYQPATVRFVLDRVVAIGAADMQARIYDPQNRQADIFGEIDTTVAALRKEMAVVSEDARYIIDDVTGEKYRLGFRAAVYITGRRGRHERGDFYCTAGHAGAGDSAGTLAGAVQAFRGGKLHLSGQGNLEEALHEQCCGK